MAPSTLRGIGAKLGRSTAALTSKLRGAPLEGGGTAKAITPIVAIAVAVIVIAATAFAVPAVLSGGAPPAAAHVYSVNFSVATEDGPTDAGTAQYSSTASIPFTVSVPYIVGIGVNASYQDQSTSPLTNPQVTLTVTGPSEGGGPWILAIDADGLSIILWPFNPVPENTSVDATSPEEAIAKAVNGTMNETYGQGPYTAELEVGSALGGRLRPGGSVSYSVDIVYYYATIEATALP